MRRYQLFTLTPSSNFREFSLDGVEILENDMDRHIPDDIDYMVIDGLRVGEYHIDIGNSKWLRLEDSE